jgi:hypothetical protein
VLKKKDTPEAFDLECTDLINKLLARRPESRLGINGTPEIKSHVWFKDINWNELKLQLLEATWIPSRGKFINEQQLEPSPLDLKGKTAL